MVPAANPSCISSPAGENGDTGTDDVATRVKLNNEDEHPLLAPHSATAEKKRIAAQVVGSHTT